MANDNVSKKPKKDKRHSYYSGVFPLKGILPQVTRQSFKKHDMVAARILTQWPDIVGKDMADYSTPARVATSRKSEKTLHIDVVSVFALEMQYQVPLVLERITSFFGFPAINSIKIHQVEKIVGENSIVDEPSKARKKNINNSQNNIVCSDDGIDEIDDEDLRKLLLSYQKQLLSL